MKKLLQLLILSDGKPGHENQSLGLAEAMARRTPAEIHVIRLDTSAGLLSRIRKALDESAALPPPDYVIAAGHRTHLSLLRIAAKFGAKSIVLMRPGLPSAWFTHCIAPEHDFKNAPSSKNIILSKGALNRVVPTTEPKSGKLLLIGGASKTHGFDKQALISQIREIASDGWQAADSRRTPDGFLNDLKNEIPGIQIFPHQETQPGWLAAKLSSLEEVWVTEDSVSMIYEALTGGAKVGVLNMPRLRPDARVIRGLEFLREAGYFIGAKTQQPPTLSEADRCAELILKGSA
ncbi:MAG: ELM1/GtrOC1 family putative glycosyltransferase [Luteolibacter sp.]